MNNRREEASVFVVFFMSLPDGGTERMHGWKDVSTDQCVHNISNTLCLYVNTCA